MPIFPPTVPPLIFLRHWEQALTVILTRLSTVRVSSANTYRVASWLFLITKYFQPWMFLALNVLNWYVSTPRFF